MPMIELMSADLPHTLYRDAKAVDRTDEEEAIRKTVEAAERKRKARENGGYTVEDVFDGIADE